MALEDALEWRQQQAKAPQKTWAEEKPAQRIRQAAKEAMMHNPGDVTSGVIQAKEEHLVRLSPMANCTPSAQVEMARQANSEKEEEAAAPPIEKFLTPVDPQEEMEAMVAVEEPADMEVSLEVLPSEFSLSIRLD